MRPTVAVIAAAVAPAYLASAQTVEFFYTDTIDTCEFKGASITANEQTTHGGVCAYRQDVERVYGCPSPDPTCWTWAQDCNDSDAGQTVCNRGGTVFCCNAVAGETCTTTDGQINVCISNFTSPNSGVSSEQANQVYLSALGVSNVTATTQTVDPTPFSTRNLVSTSATSSSSSASTTVDSTSTAAGSSSDHTSSSASATGTATGAESNTTIVATSGSSSSGLSGGAIAGIVIGAIAGLAIIGGLFFLLGRKRRPNRQNQLGSKEMPVTSAVPTAYNSSSGKMNTGYYGSQSQTGVSELGSDGHERAEMPASETARSRYEMP